MAEVYNHKVVEKKWQKVWDDEKAFAATNDYSKPKYYALAQAAICCAVILPSVFGSSRILCPVFSMDAAS